MGNRSGVLRSLLYCYTASKGSSQLQRKVQRFFGHDSFQFGIVSHHSPRKSRKLICVFFSGCFGHPILWSQDTQDIDRRMVEMQQSSRLFRIIYGHFFKPGNRNQTSITQLKRKIIFHPSSQLPSMFSFSRNFPHNDF